MADRRRSKDMLAGAGRSDVLPLGEPRDARRVGWGEGTDNPSEWTGNSRAYQGSYDCRARTRRGVQKITRLTRRTFQESGVPEYAILRQQGRSVGTGRPVLVPGRTAKHEQILSEETRKEPALCKRAGTDIQLGPESAVCQDLTELNTWMRSMLVMK